MEAVVPSTSVVEGFLLLKYGGRFRTPVSDERRHVGVHLLQDLHVERHAGAAVVGDGVERQPGQRVVALEHVPVRLFRENGQIVRLRSGSNKADQYWGARYSILRSQDKII